MILTDTGPLVALLDADDPLPLLRRIGRGVGVVQALLSA